MNCPVLRCEKIRDLTGSHPEGHEFDSRTLHHTPQVIFFYYLLKIFLKNSVRRTICFFDRGVDLVKYLDERLKSVSPETVSHEPEILFRLLIGKVGRILSASESPVHSSIVQFSLETAMCRLDIGRNARSREVNRLRPSW